ncbi:MAG: Rrf2 family transcriptional regulator [Nevskiales bacterium]
MKLTTKGRYAVTAMLDLALHDLGECPVALCDIAARQKISPAYLERLFAGLRRHNLVGATRGAGGGYRLARPSADISVAQVMAAVSEDLDATRCGGERSCHDGEGCLTHDLWEDLSRHVLDYLEAISLADLCRRSQQHCSISREAPLRQTTVRLELR